MKGSCELCSNQARLHCESDQARLCWDCDEKVHGANFLVAKHCRSLLCHVCQTPTPWKASGAKLGPTISACENCLHVCNFSDHKTPKLTRPEEEEEMNQPPGRNQEDNDDDLFSDSESEDGSGDFLSSEDDDDDELEFEEDDGENQVVPWSPSSASAPTPTCSDSSEEVDVASLHRLRHTASHQASVDYTDDEDGSSSQSASKQRPWKRARTSDPDSRAVDIVGALVRFQQNLAAGDHNHAES